MDLFKRKAGGCSSTNYAGVSDNYMLMDNALVKTGGAYKRKALKPKPKALKPKGKKKGGLDNDRELFTGGRLGLDRHDDDDDLYKGGNDNKDDFFGGGNDDSFLDGGARRRKRRTNRKVRKGGVKSNDDPDTGDEVDPESSVLGGGKRRKARKGRKNCKKGGEDLTSMLGFGSAMKGLTDNLTSMTKKDGGCGLKSCTKKDKSSKGGTGVELAPFISSLVLLGLRAANDKSFQSGITKNLGSLVGSKKSKSKTGSKSKSASLLKTKTATKSKTKTGILY